MSTNFQPLEPASPARNERGVPVSERYGDVYHTESGALAQARHVFLQGNGLPERWRGGARFTVCETGFGLGQNFLALWQAWREDPARCARLHVLSFEAHPFSRADLAAMLEAARAGPLAPLAQALLEQWPPLLPGLHRLEFEGGALTLTLALGDIGRLARQVEAGVDAFFLDGFAPRVNPEMWTPSLFGQLARLARPGATLATWCSAGQVRRDLAAAGFLVARQPGFAGKRDMTAGAIRPGVGRGGRLDPAPGAVAVVGAGPAGAAIAWALARRGLAVTVFDPALAGGPAGVHRGHHAAALTPALSRDDDLRARLSRAGARLSLALWQSLPPDARPRICGTFLPQPDPAEAAAWQAALPRLAFPPEWVRWMDGEAAGRATGLAGLPAGLWLAGGQLLRPERLLEALLAPAGVACRAEAVGGVAAEEGGWRLLDAAGRPLGLAQTLVLANAGGVPALLSTALPALPAGLAGLRRLAGQISTYDAGEAPAPQAVVAGAGYWLPAVDGLCVAGSTFEADAAVSELSPEGHAAVAQKVQALLGRALPARPAGGWAGWRVALRDRLPVIGAVPAAPGLWVASGFGSRGWNWAALAGELIAARLAGEPLPLERELLRRIAPR